MPIGIGARITQVQELFAPVYGFDNEALLENAFDIYFKDDEEFKLGGLTARVVHLPGHTPDHVGYVIGKAIFTGDSIFNVSRNRRARSSQPLTPRPPQPDVGSARADFPGGDAKDLHKVLSHRAH